MNNVCENCAFEVIEKAKEVIRLEETLFGKKRERWFCSDSCFEEWKEKLLKKEEKNE